MFHDGRTACSIVLVRGRCIVKSMANQAFNGGDGGEIRIALTDIRTDIASMQRSMEVMQRNMDVMQQNMNAMQRSMETMQHNMALMHKNITDLRQSVAVMDEKMMTKEEFREFIDKRFSPLEANQLESRTAAEAAIVRSELRITRWLVGSVFALSTLFAGLVHYTQSASERHLDLVLAAEVQKTQR
jgi:hypothetical protein